MGASKLRLCFGLPDGFANENSLILVLAQRASHQMTDLWLLPLSIDVSVPFMAAPSQSIRS
jgi:hypothetical protein